MWTLVTVTCLALLMHSVVSQDYDYQDDFICPDDLPGYFPHEISCDQYWFCDEGYAELRTCGNGLAFADTDPNYETENCDYLHNVKCGNRTELQPAKSTPHCPRPYGIFPDEEACNTFWSCWAGVPNRYICPSGLAYHRDRRICDWADQVPQCRAEESEDKFQCPRRRGGSATYSLYPHDEDCRMYYVCMNGHPREFGCPVGTVFRIGAEEGTGVCSDPAVVAGCEDYYGDVDINSLRARGF